MTANPWADFAPPTMRFNEALVDGWVRQPANAWTNIFYILIAFILFYKIYRDRGAGGAGILYAIPVCAVLIGLASFLYHASNTFFFQFFDLSSMFLFSSLLIVLNISRLKTINTGPLFIILAGLAALSSLLLFLIRAKSGLVIFGAEIAAVIILEIVIFKKTRTIKIRYSDFFIALALFLIAYGIWLTDYTRNSCFSPDNHVMQGHGLWHIINSLCFLFLYRFYRQFNWLRSGPS